MAFGEVMMMLNLFYQTVLPLSLAGSVTLLLLLVLTPAVKRLSSTWQYYIRFVAVVLFLVPFSFSLPAPQARNATVTAPVEPLYAVSEMLDAVATQPPVRQAITAAQMIALIWAVGAVLFALYKLFVWMQFHWLIKKDCVPVTDNETLGLLEVCKMHKDIRRPVRLAICERVSSPMLIGILHPTILLPRGDTPRQELRLILMHELTHSKRCDLPYKLAVLLVSTMHWFNPLAHLLVMQVTELCELSCDEAVVRRMNSSERKAYGFTILNQIGLALCKAPDVSSSFSGGKQRIERRIHLIMNFRKSKKQLLALGVCVVVALSATGVVAASALNGGKPEATPSPVSSLSGGANGLPDAENMPNYGEQTANVMPYSEGGGDTQQAQAPAYGPNGGVLAEPEQKALEDALIQLQADVRNANTEEQVAALRAEQEQIQANLDNILAQNDALVKTDSASSPEETAAALKEFKATKEVSDELKAVVQKLDWVMPLEGIVASGLWGYWGHTGIDMIAAEGTEIYAAADGTVSYSSSESYGYGKHIIINHGDHVFTLYGHCKELFVKEGDVVKQGDKIATVGRSGNATGFNCHVELRVSGEYLDIQDFVD